MYMATDIRDYDERGSLVREAGRRLARLSAGEVNQILADLARETEESIPTLLAANAEDLSRMDKSDPRYDRLLLTEARLRDIAGDLRHVAELPSPLGRTLAETVRPNGLRLRRVSVPFGVIGIIFEARPNVCFDCFALCLKAGSACILKGGSDAGVSCQAIVGLIHRVLLRHGLPPETAMLLTTHEATDWLLQARQVVDLIIPRGSQRLIDYVRSNARVPVIETGAGVVHTYVDRAADLAKAIRIVVNGKTRRVSVCNALDCLIIHRDRLADLPALLEPLRERGVEVVEEYGTEFLSLRMAVKVVDSLDEALAHIRRYGSGHSESIVTEDEAAARRFQQEVDAACVYWNAPTSFTDGAQFGLGAEIGISTQKLHARGPMALEEITTYKWLIEGDGQIRA